MFTKIWEMGRGGISGGSLTAPAARTAMEVVKPAGEASRDLPDPIVERLSSIHSSVIEDRQERETYKELLGERFDFNDRAKELIDSIVVRKTEKLKVRSAEIRERGRKQAAVVESLMNERQRIRGRMVEAEGRAETAELDQAGAIKERQNLSIWASDEAIAEVENRIESCKKRFEKARAVVGEAQSAYNFLSIDKIPAEMKKLSDLKDDLERCTLEINGFDPAAVGLGLQPVPMKELLDRNDPILSRLRNMFQNPDAQPERKQLRELISEREDQNTRAQAFFDARTVRIVERIEKKQTELLRRRAIALNSRPVDQILVDELALELEKCEVEMSGGDPSDVGLGIVGNAAAAR